MCKKSVCIRVEGGMEIGMGHVMRMLELAKEAHGKANVFFVSKVNARKPDAYQPGIRMIRDSGFRVIELTEADFYGELGKIRADVFLSDSYDVSEEYFSRIKPMFPVNGYMDDEGICEYFNVDFIINQNPYADKISYHTNADTKLFLGLNYLILRDEFIGKSYTVKKDIDNIMITLGGSDNDNVSEILLRQLIPLRKNICLVVGKAFIHCKQLEEYCKYNVDLCYDAKMSDVMQWCDLAITGCGITVYEIASMGVPAIGLSLVENQEMCVDKMEELGALMRGDIRNIICSVQQMDYLTRYEMHEHTRELLDGLGKKRIIDYLLTC